MEKCKALIAENGHISVRQLAVPHVTTGKYGVLCRMRYGSTCTATDRHIVQGVMPFKIEYPCIVGHESIGEVIEVGSEVKNFRIGDLVTRVGYPTTKECFSYWGGYAEYGVTADYLEMARQGIPAKNWSMYRVSKVIPSGINPKDAPMLITWRETASFFNRLCIKPGEKVLIIGSGGNGLAFLAHCVDRGASVVMCGSAVRMGVAKVLGAEAYVDYRSDTCADELKAASKGGFDFIIDAIGRADTLEKALPVLREGGRATVYGMDDIKNLVIHPMNYKSFTFVNTGYDEPETHNEIVERVLLGKLDAKNWLTNYDNPVTLDELAQRLPNLDKEKVVKLLIKF